MRGECLIEHIDATGMVRSIKEVATAKASNRQSSVDRASHINWSHSVGAEGGVPRRDTAVEVCETEDGAGSAGANREAAGTRKCLSGRSAGRRARGWNSHDQRLRSAVALVKRRHALTLIRDPERGCRRKAHAPWID